MKKIILFTTIFLVIMLSGCAKYQTVPEEYQNHPCAKHCYISSTQGMDGHIVNHSGG